MSATERPIAFELFEAFHGRPSTPWDGTQCEHPAKIFSEPHTLDLRVNDDSARLVEFGLSPKYVETIAEDDPTLEHELRQQLLEKKLNIRELEAPSDAVYVNLMKAEVRYLPYVDTVTQSGYFLTICPISGRAVKSSGSFITDTHHIAYRFVGEIVFYVMVGRFHGRRAALCVPSLNLLVTLNVPERGPPIARWVAQLMHRLIGLSISEPDKFRRGIESNTETLSLVIGGMGNFGHHVWQELSGIAALIAKGDLPRVRSLIVGPHIWFRPELVFPELTAISITRCENAEDMLVNGPRQPGTLLRPVGMQITGDLRMRIHNAAEIVLGPARKYEIVSAGRRNRLVWINLRAHNKMWLSQVEGYASLLNALQEDFGNIGVVYDGWRDTTMVRDEIDRRLRDDVVRYDTIGAAIDVSLIWAEAVTTYVSVVGSGLVLNSWLVNKPGVAHANRAHLRQNAFWNSASQGMIPTNFIDPATVSDDGTLYGNYDFDWRALLPPLRHALSTQPPKQEQQ